MGELSESAACLRLFGDDLIPDDITTLLGHEPMGSDIKGELSKTLLPRKQVLLSKTGSWRLSFERRRPADLNGQIEEIIEILTDDSEKPLREIQNGHVLWSFPRVL